MEKFLILYKTLVKPLQLHQSPKVEIKCCLFFAGSFSKVKELLMEWKEVGVEGGQH
jgi:hypothetical protein